MKNKLFYYMKNKVNLKITGKNINRFLTRLNNNNIEILKCNHINETTIKITIYLKDYDKLKKIKTIYEIETINTSGIIKIKKKLNINKYLILFIILGYILLLLLSNIIFEIEIIHTDSEIRKIIKDELKIYGIKEKTFKKNYKKIQNIKNQILNKYKNKIEWLEIENKGTKYIVKIEERKIKEQQNQKTNRNIVAKKSAIIKKIKAKSGQIIKEINNYVEKGDTVIDGNIYLNETLKKTVPAEGIVYGEVWYEVTVAYPYTYHETKETNNKKTVLTIKLFNKNIEIFNLKPYKTKKIEEEIIIKNNILPISLVKQKQTETKVIEDILTEEQTIEKAIEKGINQIKNNLKEEEYIMNYKILNTNIKENEIELKIFFSVYENITEYSEIKEN